MQHQSMTTAIAGGWIAAIVLAGLFFSVTSVLGLTLLAGLALVPPLGMLWLWNTPRESMSESIQKALR